MLIHIEQRHIDAATAHRTDKSLPWGCRCPIARATCEQLNLPLGSVYAGPVSTYIDWGGHQLDTSEFSVLDSQSRWSTTDSAGEFMAKMDNVCDSLDIEPCTVELSQRPLHCPIKVTKDGFTAVTDDQR